MARAKDKQERNALIGFVVGGMAGLRLREIAAITRADFDAKAGTLQTGTKNDASIRCIPLLSGVVSFIQSCFETDPSQYLVHHRGVNGNDNQISRGMRRVLDEAGLPTISPKDAARKTAINWMKQPGVDSDCFNRYVGHSAKTTVDRFYREYSTEQLRLFVIEPVQAYLDSRVKPAAQVVVDLVA